ncbi:MAG: hypothetical protein KKA81_05395 [Bacteroidetes bacterium]|nr:hypothetical protein [Bacteroidota bacterium]
MGRLVMLVLVIFTGMQAGFSQERTFHASDSITYSLYLHQDWDRLVKKGKEALGAGTDYFYLRMRLGIAYYEKHNYIEAARQFRRALDFNSLDKDAWTYYYYSLKFSGQNDVITSVNRKIPSFLKQSLKIPENKFLEMVYAEGGLLTTNNISKNSDLNIMGKDQIYGEQLLYGNGRYAHAGVRFRLSDRVKMYVGYNFIEADMRKRFEYTLYEAKVDSVVYESWGYSKYYSFPVTDNQNIIDYKVRQNELYLNATFTLKNEIQIIPAFHYSMLNFPVTEARYEPQEASDTAYFVYDGQQTFWFTYERPAYSFTTRNVSTNDYLGALSVNKSFSRFNGGISAIYSSLNERKFFQIDGRLTWFPSGNLNFYSTTELRNFLTDKEYRLIFHQVLGGRILSWLWTEGSVTVGDLSYTSENNGLVIFTITDKIKYRLAMRLIFPLSEHLSFNLRYQFLAKEGVYAVFHDSPKGEFRFHSFDYFHNNFFGGIQWNF